MTNKMRLALEILASPRRSLSEKGKPLCHLCGPPCLCGGFRPKKVHHRGTESTEDAQRKTIRFPDRLRTGLRLRGHIRKSLRSIISTLSAKPIRLMLVLVGLGLLLSSNGDRLALRNSKATAADTEKRIRFQITTIEETSAARNVLSEASVEGAPGTDFTINLQSAGFKMNARFLTDLVNQNALKVRTKLETRRFFGYSEQKLPVYEEDNQTQTLQLNFDEGIVLVPFGSHGGSSVLKIEIKPSWSSQTVRDVSGKLRPLQIDLGKTSLGGSINIQASHKPHRFAVDAVLYEDGQEVARGSSNSSLEEAGEFTLRPNEKASAEVRENPLFVNFRVDEYSRSRPVDEVVIGFDIFRVTQQDNSRSAPVGLNWAGAGELGSALKYDLTRYYLSTSGHRYELRFTVKLGEGEIDD